MRRFGLNDPVRPPDNEVINREAATKREYASRRYGVSNLDSARQFGYGLPPWTQGSARPQAIGKLSTAEQLALVGRQQPSEPSRLAGQPIPEGGCTGEAERQIRALDGSHGDGQGLDPKGILSQTMRDSFARAKSDPRVISVFKRWSDCMHNRGYSYPDPFRPAEEFSKRTADSAASKAEIDTAVADIACKLQTNLLGVTFAVEAELQNAEIETNAEYLKHVKDRNESRNRVVARLWVQTT